MKYSLRYFLCALLLVLSSAQISQPQNQLPDKPSQKPFNRPGEDADFQRYLRSGRISIVAFYADWCPACRQWDPVLDVVNAYFPDMQVLFMDILDSGTPVTAKYGIESIPHFQIYDPSGDLIIEGENAGEWLQQAIKTRLRASEQGNYRFTGQPSSRPRADQLNRPATTRLKTARPKAIVSAEPGNLPGKIDSKEPLPSLDQIIGRFVEAVGGNTVSGISTKSIKGKLQIPSVGKGSFEIYAKAPTKVLIIFDIPGVGSNTVGFNGVSAWTRDSRTGLRTLNRKEIASVGRESDFFGPVRLKDYYSSMKVLGISKVGFREAYVIERKIKTGDIERLYFSKETGLIIRVDAFTMWFGSLMQVEMYLDNWTDVQGIKIPMSITQMFPQMSMNITFEEVKFDAPLDDAIFNRPK